MIDNTYHNFTIRAWSHLALRQTAFRYVCQSSLHRRAHQPGLCPPSYAFPPAMFAKLSRDERPGLEVSPLSRGVMYPFDCSHGALSRFNLYPSHYRKAFASSTILYPQPHWLTLR